jgi:hypothetical protein
VLYWYSSTLIQLIKLIKLKQLAAQLVGTALLPPHRVFRGRSKGKSRGVKGAGPMSSSNWTDSHATP